jgi:hypothetical protein
LAGEFSRSGPKFQRRSSISSQEKRQKLQSQVAKAVGRIMLGGNGMAGNNCTNHCGEHCRGFFVDESASAQGWVAVRKSLWLFRS